uniref:NADH dehydrogenase subunit 6 n=1 Tax=Nysius inconspicuus TaxID=1689977 RepID=UPI00286B776B|nr:NADH dehydrogenase subunit 6 [Nysius inconspicuus]WJZ45493.1 NADH dehydrogenase subunit 6 [Nysius inconspicuus]
MNMFMWIMLNLSLTFMSVKHPLSMVLIIILQTLTISVMIGMMLSSFWFSYIIMMIMMSGMLVLFIYMASVASNEKFKFSIILTMMMILNSPILFLNYDNEMMNMNKTTTLNMILNNLFSGVTMMITIIMVMYLLYTMITVSKIVNINEGPLRIKK